MRTVGAVLFAAMATCAEAAPADCLLEVRGMTYIDGMCDFEADSDGSFTVAAGDYFATVLIDTPNRGAGYWNENPRAQHAHSPLGALRRKGACWSNDQAQICAWKPGERR